MSLGLLLVTNEPLLYQNLFQQNSDKIYRITSDDSTAKVGRFKSILELVNVGLDNAGDYFCISVDYLNRTRNDLNELRPLFKVSSIYLFVDGKTYLHFLYREAIFPIPFATFVYLKRAMNFYRRTKRCLHLYLAHNSIVL